MAYKGRFRPKNPKKYLGDPTNIIFRSLWELRAFKLCDTHPNIKKWASEEIIIPYKSPIDGKFHRYFPDIYIEQVDKDGKERKLLIEIKPYKQTRPPDRSKITKKDGGIKKAYIEEVKTWGVNSAKWEAAEKFCNKKGWEFSIMTERELFGQK